jgi:phosphatidylinositol-3-phosphatase
VIWVIFENQPPVVGASSAPTFNSLAAECGVATNYSGITHPSLPNYLALTGGSTFGVTDDEPPSSHPIAGESIFSQLGTEWRSYQESMPSNCLQSNSGDYAVKHNPASYFTDVKSACDSQDVPMGTTTSGAFHDAVTGGTLPAFSLVTPNLCHDMHDCSVATGDAWLKPWMAQILASPTYAAGHTAVVITFDENDGSAGDLVSTIVIAPSVIAGTQNGAVFNHYSLLRTTEELLGLPATVGAAATATSMRDAFHL